AEFGRSACQSFGLGNFLPSINNPTTRLALRVTARRQAISRSEFRVELDRTAKILQRLAVGFASPTMDARQAAQEVVVSVEAFGWLASGALNLGLSQAGRDRANDFCRHLVLEVEDVLQGAVETVGPQLHAVRPVDELPCNAHPVSRLAHAAFKHIADTKLAADLLHFDAATFVGKCGISGDHEQPAHAR